MAQSETPPFSFRPLFRELSNSFNGLGLQRRAEEAGPSGGAPLNGRRPPPLTPPPPVPNTSILDREQQVGEAERTAASLMALPRVTACRGCTTDGVPYHLQIVVGVLLKYVNLAAGWHPRLFVLQGGVLRYYKVRRSNGCSRT